MSYKRNRAMLLTAFITAMISLSSCKQDTDILAEYEGVNLIADKGFGPEWVPDDLTGLYMTYEEVTGVSLPAGVTGAPIYRLETNNLVADGKFEVNGLGSLPASAWGEAGVATAAVSDVVVDSGQSLYFDIPSIDDADFVSFDLSTITDGYPQYTNYILRFDFKAANANTFLFYFPTHDSNNDEIDLHSASVPTASTTFAFPDDFIVTTSEFTSTVLPGDSLKIVRKAQSGYIDNFRITRTDKPFRLRIDLPWSDTGTQATPLVSGWYKFTVWVRGDPLAASTQNSFATDKVTIGIENSLELYQDIDTASWTSISTVLFVQIDRPDDVSQYVLQLSVSPTNIVYANGRDVGSILITAPSLELFSSDPG